MLYYIGKDKAEEIGGYHTQNNKQSQNPREIGHENYNKIPNNLKPEHIGVHPEYDLGLILSAIKENPGSDIDISISLTDKQINQCVTIEQIKSVLSSKETIGGNSYIHSIIRSLNVILPESLSEGDIRDIAGYINHQYIGGGEKYDKFIKLIKTDETQRYIHLLAGKNKLIKKLFDPQFNNIIRKILYGKEDTGVALIQHHTGADKSNIDFLLQFDSFSEENGTIKGTVKGVNGTSKTWSLEKIDGKWTSIPNPNPEEKNPIENNPLKMSGLDKIQINIPKIGTGDIDGTFNEVEVDDPAREE